LYPPRFAGGSAKRLRETKQKSSNPESTSTTLTTMAIGCNDHL
jgi:hypothetical protein